MKWSKGIVLSLFTFIITSIAIYLNWSEFFMGNYATSFNFAVSTVFMLLWFIFSLYWGAKQEKVYKKFILIYWGINIVSFALIWIVLQHRFSAASLLPFTIWYGSPVYGFAYLLKSNISALILITAPLGLIFCTLGYWIGLMMSKVSKS